MLRSFFKGFHIHSGTSVLGCSWGHTCLFWMKFSENVVMIPIKICNFLQFLFTWANEPQIHIQIVWKLCCHPVRINYYNFDLFKCRSKNVRLHKIRLLYLLLLHILFKMVKLGKVLTYLRPKLFHSISKIKDNSYLSAFWPSGFLLSTSKFLSRQLISSSRQLRVESRLHIQASCK